MKAIRFYRLGVRLITTSVGVTASMLPDSRVFHFPWLLIMSALVVLFGSSPVRAYEYEPGVREVNSQLTAGFTYSHRESENPAPEQDGYAGAIEGVVSFPIERELGGRLFLSSSYGETEFDGSRGDVESGSVALGGDLFLRYAKIFELAAGPRYGWIDEDPPSGQKSSQFVGGFVGGRLFFEGFGFGPIDLELSGDYRHGAAGTVGNIANGDRYAAGGGFRLYPFDIFSIRATGSWSRSNFSTRQVVEEKLGNLDLDFLIPGRPALTLGLNFSGGEEESSFTGQSTFSRAVFRAGVRATLSFPGADSLIELERNYY